MYTSPFLASSRYPLRLLTLPPSPFLRLGRNIDGRVKITHLADGFVKDYKSIHAVGDLVTAKVLE